MHVNTLQPLKYKKDTKLKANDVVANSNDALKL